MNEDQRERDLDEEIQAHLNLAEADGHSPESARRDFGNVTLIKEQAREIWGRAWLDNLGRDLRYAFVQLRRNPGFTVATVLLTALGIAAAMQMFVLVDAVLLRPLPVRDPQSLVQLFEIHPVVPPDAWFRPALLRDIQEHSSTMMDVVGQTEMTAAVDLGGKVERIHPYRVSDGYFQALGVSAALGRVLADGDDRTAVLSHSYWLRAFAGDPHVIGRTIHLYKRPFTIVGVAPAFFIGTIIDSSPEMWIPGRSSYNLSDIPTVRADETYIESSAWEIIARLRPGVTLARARAESALFLKHYYEDLARREPDANQLLGQGRAEVRSIAHGRSPLRDQSSAALWLLLSGAGLLLLMVCANTGALLLARASAREKDTAVRLAIGARRFHIARLWIAESLVLTTAGGLLGMLIAWATTPSLAHLVPPARDIGFNPNEIRVRTFDLHPDLRIAAFGAAICALVAIVVSIAPVWRSARHDLWSGLKIALGDARQRRFQSGLCALQIAFCAVLLVFAGLMIRSLSRLEHVNTGFSADHIALFRVDPYSARYTNRQTIALQRRLVAGARALPGVDAAAIAGTALMRGIGVGNIIVTPSHPAADRLNTSANEVTPEYFETMGIRFLAGHGLDRGESPKQKPRSAVVNQTFARRFFPGENPIGKVFSTGRKWTAPDFRVVGIVNDTHYRSLRETPPPLYYTGFAAVADDNQDYNSFVLHVRAHGDPDAVIAEVRGLLLDIDPHVPFYEVSTIKEDIRNSLWEERMLVALATAFGIFAVLLSAIGLYGILAYFVAARRREIGLRIAVGAMPGHICGLLGRQLVPAVAIGLVVGAALSYAAGVWARSLLYEIGRSDPWSIGAALAIVFTVVAIAAALPTWRALRLNPASTLRQE